MKKIKKEWFSTIIRKELETALNNITEFIVFDTETSGINANKDVIIQLSGIKFEIKNGEFIEKEEFDRYIKPANPISKKITEITGITNDFLADEQPEDIVFPEIIKFFDGIDCVVAHNSPFDMRMMKALYARHVKPFEPKYILDTLTMCRQTVPKSEVEGYKLCMMIDYFGLNTGFEYHSAIEDVRATCKLFQLMVDEYQNTEEDFSRKLSAKILNVSRYDGFRGMVRWYVITSRGTIFYDVRGKCWNEKTPNTMSFIDLAQIETDFLKYLKVDSLAEVGRVHQKTLDLISENPVSIIQHWKDENKIPVVLTAKKDKDKLQVYYLKRKPAS